MNKIDIEIVNFYYGINCNLSCNGCFSGSDIIKHNRYDPTLDSILTSIEDFSRVANVKQMVTLIGGEPLMYWDTVVPMARHVRKYFPNVDINLTTNGFRLKKYQDELISLMIELQPFRISLTDHLSEVDHADTLATKYYDQVKDFLSDPRLNKIHQHHYDIPNNQVNIHIGNYAGGFKAQYLIKHRKLKPFATNDPEGSMREGCTGNICSAVVDSKLYKCPRFYVLPLVLKERNQIDDPDWQKYLNYRSIDLTNCTQEELEYFENNQGKPIEECDMCPNNKIINISLIPHTKENLIPQKNE
jgi:organic radical activating enzyme